MDFDIKWLQPYEELFYGIVPSKGSYPIGEVILPVTFGTQANNNTEPMLARFMAIPHHTYLILKMSAPNGILSIYGDIETSNKCDTKVVQLVEALENSTKATAMVAEA
ncbi:uncharacterized protein [Setaria viridis]|uniref:uncharacterized protein n=1 Tax=Setaria viridis TaxID=4556 RepID=UPI001493DB7D|nr:uncharacterized protein LOC117835601 [Setaria viridis]